MVIEALAVLGTLAVFIGFMWAIDATFDPGDGT